MPETGIGYFPDVGASYFLPRCISEMGMYLGLTGSRLYGQGSVEAGIATHYVKSDQISNLVGSLEKITNNSDVYKQVTDIILEFNLSRKGEIPSQNLDAIGRCFSKDSVEDIFYSLDRLGTEWAQETIATLRKKSPTGLKVTFRQLREGKSLDFESCMVMELRLALRFMAQSDFYEGVRAVIIEKDNEPNWRPNAINKVTAEEVEKFFLPLPEGDLVF